MLTRREFLFGAAMQAVPSRRKPNIVILLADDLGYGECGFQGNGEIPTPHIDSIAANGVRFTQGYVSAPFCTPSRAGLMTGRYQTRFGHERNATGKTNLLPHFGLPLDQRTMADYLKAAGYATAAIGKWHLGGQPQHHPLRRGFDEFFGFLHEGHFYFPPPYRGAVTRLREKEPPYDDDNPVLRGTEPITESAYLTDALAREAVRFMERNRNRPFFLYLPFNAIHSPMQAPVPLMTEVESIRDEHRRLFAAMMRSMDNAVGKVLDKLKELRLEEDTLVVFLSDNGGPTGELTSSNKPLRGFKGQLYEGGIRIPFAMQWKGRIPAGKTDHRPVISLDILPTALAAAQASSPQPLDGVNLLPFVTGENTGAPHEVLFWRYGPNIALRRGALKLVRQAGVAEFQLFDVQSDASESKNIASEKPEAATDLRKVLEGMDAQMARPLW
ncbi:MAG: sulfatase [Candidatus Solibacter usitatus]|nr:sulfatase [Candidatus Solibacter usitatus]